MKKKPIIIKVRRPDPLAAPEVDLDEGKIFEQALRQREAIRKKLAKAPGSVPLPDWADLERRAKK